MEPDTAFWILSSAAQSAAALAGLSALLLVFILRETKRELDADDVTWGYDRLVERIPFFRLLSVGTVLYLAAVLISIVTLGLVTPGLPVGAEVEAITFLSVILLGGGSAALVAFIWRPIRWADSAA